LRNFIRALWVLASIISAAGCAHVEILSTRIADLDSKHLVVEIVTSKDLRQFDHTYYADHVYLSYRAENTSVSSNTPAGNGLIHSAWMSASRLHAVFDVSARDGVFRSATRAISISTSTNTCCGKVTICR